MGDEIRDQYNEMKIFLEKEGFNIFYAKEFVASEYDHIWDTEYDWKKFFEIILIHSCNSGRVMTLLTIQDKPVTGKVFGINDEMSAFRQSYFNFRPIMIFRTVPP